MGNWGDSRGQGKRIELRVCMGPHCFLVVNYPPTPSGEDQPPA